MKNSITGLELHYLVKELQALKDARLDKVYQSEKKELLMSFHVTGKGKHLLKIMAGSYLYLTEYKDVAQEPTSFCMFLRKQLGNARLRSIEQVGEERIVKLEFLAGDEKQLYIELFGKGNIILCDSSNVILGVEETQRWTDRTVKKGEKYKYPKKEFLFTKITKKDILMMAEQSKDTIVKMLAASLGLGGLYAEEACFLSKVDKNKKAKEVNDKEAKAVADAIKGLVSKELTPVGMYKEGILVEALPFPLNAYKEAEQKKFKSYSNLLDSIFTEAAVKTKEKGKTKLYDQKIQKIQKIIDVQEKRISELLEEYEKNSEKGNKLYEHYQVVDSIIKQLNKAWKEKKFEEIKEKLKGHKIIKDVKRKGEVVVELK
ncbi:NFACT family protein [Candidatus Woesearchaeota archaeon]|nr:NFACT family protein [Candidatus Woesearchaeota archaeon]